MTVAELIAMLSDQPLQATVQFTNLDGMNNIVPDSAIVYNGGKIVEILIR